MSIRRVALIYNPASGQQHARRAAQIEAAASVLRAAGVQAEPVLTTGPGSAGEQAAECIRRGCDTIFACGGDGTVHEVLQGMVGSAAALGVIPLGTANALAIDLGLPAVPHKAARVLLAATPTRIAVGKISYQERNGEVGSRFFTVAAGIGPDAHLMYRLNAQRKRRFGYAVYVAAALRTWATHSYPLFELELCSAGRRRLEQVSQLLAVRISNFGGILRRLAPGAALRRDDLRLVAFKTRSRARYLQYLTSIFLGMEPRMCAIELLDATGLECRSLTSRAGKIYVEADGELLGTLPARIEIVPDALTLLAPSSEPTALHSRYLKRPASG
jgi:diacylglycerol kinase (ATP)